MTYGGLPQVVGLQSERQKADYLKNIFANVYLKDVIEQKQDSECGRDRYFGVMCFASAIGATY